jgi:hypothetical protein
MGFSRQHPMLRLASSLLVIISLGLVACAPSPAPAAQSAAGPQAAKATGSVADRMKAVAAEIDSALSAVAAGDLAKANQAYEEYDEGWESVEDDVKAKSATAYKSIEDAMDEVDAALTKAAKPDATKAREALTKLKQTIESNLAALS